MQACSLAVISSQETYFPFFDLCFLFAELNGKAPGGTESPLAGKLFIVLGAGGAGKSLAYGGAQKGARVVVANRTFGNILSLCLTIEFYSE